MSNTVKVLDMLRSVKSNTYIQFTHAVTQNIVEADTGLQPIASCPHASSLKIAH